MKYTRIASRDTAELREGHQRKTQKATSAKEEPTTRTKQGAKSDQDKGNIQGQNENKKQRRQGKHKANTRESAQSSEPK